MRQIVQGGSPGIGAILRESAMEALGGRLGSLCGSSILRRRGSEDSPEGESRRALYPERGRFSPGRIEECASPARIEASASFSHIVQKAPDLSDGGPHLPYTQDGLHHFETPLSFAACKAVTLEDAVGCILTDPEKIVLRLHVDWGHASAQQSKRVLVDSERNNAHLLTRAGEVLAQREVRPAFEKSPRDLAAEPRLWPWSLRRSRRIHSS